MRNPLAYIWISELVTNKVMRLPLGQPACIWSGFWGQGPTLCGENGNQSSDQRTNKVGAG